MVRPLQHKTTTQKSFNSSGQEILWEVLVEDGDYLLHSLMINKTASPHTGEKKIKKQDRIMFMVQTRTSTQFSFML